MSEQIGTRKEKINRPGERLLNVYQRLVAENPAGAYKTHVEGWYVVFSKSYDGNALLVMTIRTQEADPNDSREESDFIHLASDEPNNWRPTDLSLGLNRKEFLNRLTIVADLAEQAEW